METLRQLVDNLSLTLRPRLFQQRNSTGSRPKMAESSDVETRYCVVWNTQRPYLNKQRYSPSFRLLDSQWRLRLKMISHPFSYSTKINVIYLERVDRSERLKKCFRVTTFIEDNVDYNFPSLGFTTVVRTGSEIIWQYEHEQVSTTIPFVVRGGHWRVVCVFRGVQRPATQDKNGTIQLSERSGLNLLKSVTTLPDLESLSLDLSSLFKDEVFSDVKFRCGDTTIPAHRAVLAARSEVFAAMFRNKMVESETGVVEVTDMEPQALDLFLKYLYTGKLQDLPEEIATLLDLYEASDKYAVHTLEKACSDRLIANLNLHNCFTFLTVADAHCDADFKEIAISFICCNQVVLESEAWLQFCKNPSDLVMEVHQKVFGAYNHKRL